MEASEAIRRIFWRHRWLLLILTLVPALIVVPLKERQTVTYAATATIQGQATTPDATTQVQAIQSRVTAVATAPAVVQTAITQAKVNRSAPHVAKHEIAVTSLSASAIMQVTVTDRSRPVALALAGSLATAVVNQLNELGVQGNPELAVLNKTASDLSSRRSQLLKELNSASASNAATSVAVQSLLSQLSAVEQEQAANESEAQQVLGTLTTETGASVISTPTQAVGASRHAAVDGGLAALLGLILALLFATLREVLRPTVGQPAAGARELGAVLLGSSVAHGNEIISLDPGLPERLNLAAHRAGVLTIVLTGPGSRDRLSALAGRLRDELPPTEQADGRGVWTRSAAGREQAGDEVNSGGARRQVLAENGTGPRPVGLAADWSTDKVRETKPRRTVVTLNDIRLGAPPTDAALVVALPRFAPHGALDQAADLGVTADWPILGVIGIRHQSRLSSLVARLTGSSAAPDAAALRQGAREEGVAASDVTPGVRVPGRISREQQDD